MQKNSSQENNFDTGFTMIDKEYKHRQGLSFLDKKEEENIDFSSFEQAEMTRKQKLKVDFIEYIIIFCCLVSIGLSIISYNIQFNELPEMYSTNSVILSFISFITVCMIVLVFFKNYHYKRLKIQRKEAPKDFPLSEIFGWKKIIAEFIFISIHPNIICQNYKIRFYSGQINNYYYYNLNDILTMICSFKSSYLLGLLLFRTAFGTSRSGRVTSMFGCTISLRFIIKCILKQKPLSALTTLLLYGVLFFGFLIMVAESPIDKVVLHDIKFSYQNSCWLVIITMTTVGYGDINPMTEIGKLVIIFISLFGIVVVSLMVVIISKELEFSGPEGNAYTVLRKLQYKEQLKISAIKMQRSCVRYHVMDDGSKKIRLSATNPMDKSAQMVNIEVFKKIRRDYKMIGEASLFEEVGRNFAICFNHMTDIKDMLNEEKSGFMNETTIDSDHERTSKLDNKKSIENNASSEIKTERSKKSNHKPGFEKDNIQSSIVSTERKIKTKRDSVINTDSTSPKTLRIVESLGPKQQHKMEQQVNQEKQNEHEFIPNVSSLNKENQDRKDSLNYADLLSSIDNNTDFFPNNQQQNEKQKKVYAIANTRKPVEIQSSTIFDVENQNLIQERSSEYNMDSNSVSNNDHQSNFKQNCKKNDTEYNQKNVFTKQNLLISNKFQDFKNTENNSASSNFNSKKLDQIIIQKNNTSPSDQNVHTKTDSSLIRNSSQKTIFSNINHGISQKNKFDVKNSSNDYYKNTNDILKKIDNDLNYQLFKILSETPPNTEINNSNLITDSNIKLPRSDSISQWGMNQDMISQYNPMSDKEMIHLTKSNKNKTDDQNFNNLGTTADYIRKETLKTKNDNMHGGKKNILSPAKKKVQEIRKKKGFNNKGSYSLNNRKLKNQLDNTKLSSKNSDSKSSASRRFSVCKSKISYSPLKISQRKDRYKNRPSKINLLSGIQNISPNLLITKSEYEIKKSLSFEDINEPDESPRSKNNSTINLLKPERIKLGQKHNQNNLLIKKFRSEEHINSQRDIKDDPNSINIQKMGDLQEFTLSPHIITVQNSSNKQSNLITNRENKDKTLTRNNFKTESKPANQYSRQRNSIIAEAREEDS